MFIRQVEVGAASETADISEYWQRREEEIIVAMAVQELGINLRPFQVDVIRSLVYPVGDTAPCIKMVRRTGDGKSAVAMGALLMLGLF